MWMIRSIVMTRMIWVMMMRGLHGHHGRRRRSTVGMMMIVTVASDTPSATMTERNVRGIWMMRMMIMRRRRRMLIGSSSSIRWSIFIPRMMRRLRRRRSVHVTGMRQILKGIRRGMSLPVVRRKDFFFSRIMMRRSGSRHHLGFTVVRGEGLVPILAMMMILVLGSRVTAMACPWTTSGTSSRCVVRRNPRRGSIFIMAMVGLRRVRRRRRRPQGIVVNMRHFHACLCRRMHSIIYEWKKIVV